MQEAGCLRSVPKINRLKHLILGYYLGGDGMAVTHDGQYLYVTHYLEGFESSVSVTRTSNNTVLKRIPLDVSHIPGPLAITPDGADMYVTARAQPGNVYVIRITSQM